MNEVRREGPDKHAQIISEVTDSITSSEEFSFLLWDHVANKEEGNSTQLMGRQENGVWRVAILDTTTGEPIGEVQTFNSSEEMLASDLGQKAIEMSSYRSVSYTHLRAHET